jgi:hypothetical protein
MLAGAAKDVFSKQDARRHSEGHAAEAEDFPSRSVVEGRSKSSL